MVENKDTLLQHKCFVCKKCHQVKVIQAVGKVVAYREKCTQVKVIQAAGKVVAYREKVYTG